MPLFAVHHHTNNGGDFKWLHTRHVLEAADETDAKTKSLELIDAAHKYNDSTRPNFTTSVSPAAVGEKPTVEPIVAEQDADKEGE
jgi:hypothetical protein